MIEPDNERPVRKTAGNGADPQGDAGRDDPDRWPDGTFAPGNPAGPGRPKGAMGRSNREIVEAIIEAFHLRGGIEYLKGLNDADFVKLVGRILPREIKVDEPEHLTIILRGTTEPTPLTEMSADRLHELAGAVEAEIR